MFHAPRAGIKVLAFEAAAPRGEEGGERASGTQKSRMWLAIRGLPTTETLLPVTWWAVCSGAAAKMKKSRMR
ncbi:unnamed protein product, partial [Staurois parvus]